MYDNPSLFVQTASLCVVGLWVKINLSKIESVSVALVTVSCDSVTQTIGHHAYSQTFQGLEDLRLKEKSHRQGKLFHSFVFPECSHL